MRTPLPLWHPRGMRYAIWNGLVAADVEALATPRDEAEVCALVVRARRQGKHLRAIGAGHSFNDLSLCEDLLVDLRQLTGVVAIDPEHRLVRVRGGTPLKHLIPALTRAGLALANIGAWTEQTIAGVVSTATHGTAGRHRRSLIDSVVGLRLVDGTGAVQVLEGDALHFVTLGYFGVITEVTLRCEPFFHVRQDKLVMDGSEAIAAIDELLHRHDFVDLRWAGRAARIIVGRWDIVPTIPTLRDRLARGLEGVQIGAINRLLALVRVDVLPTPVRRGLFDGLASAYVTTGRGLPHETTWHDGLTFNSFGVAAPHEEREFALSRERAAACLLAVRDLMRTDRSAAGVEIQVRFSPPTPLRLAPNEGRDTVWFNINSLDLAGTSALVARLSSLALQHGGRPHWGKILPGDTPSIDRLYGDSVGVWEARRRSLDPDGLFLNDFYHRHFGLHPVTRPERDETA